MEESLKSAEKVEEHPKMTLKLEEAAYGRRHSLFAWSKEEAWEVNLIIS